MASLVTPPASAFAKLSQAVYPSRKTKLIQAAELTSKRASASWKSRRCSTALNMKRRHPLQIQCQARTLTQTQPLSALELEDRFGSENLQFSEVAGMTVVQLKLRTGTTARLLANEARITSYRCRLWHGSCEEFFHTDVSEQVAIVSNEHSPLPSFLVTGGMFLSFAHSHPPQPVLFQDNWFLESVKVDPREHIQVTLRCGDPNEHGDGGWQYSLKSIITLTNTFLASAVLLTNCDKRPLTFTGSVSTHLAIAETEALCASGLQGCRYFSPSETAGKEAEAQSFWGKLRRLALPPHRTADPHPTLTEERNDQPHWYRERPKSFVSFRTGSHKVYSEPPKQFRLTDQGLRRSLLFESHGFENLEVSCPETDEDKPYVSIGASSFLSPITLHPNQTWRGAQVLTPDT